MKKVYALAGIVVLSLTMAFTAYATNSAGQESQTNAQQATPGTGGSTVGKEAVISGENDQRLINPQMNYRERVEMQRAVQKRAAAKRNALLQAAEARKINQGGAHGNSVQAPK